MWRNSLVAFVLCVTLVGMAVGKDVASKAGEPNLITFSRIDKAWQYSRGENIKVAVLDWLFDMSPKASAKYVNPTSMVPGAEVGAGEPWHGEWMAEIVHQIAPQAKIIPIRARPATDKERDAEGRYVYEKYLIQGIRFAADQGAVAVTSSMGPLTQSRELRDAIDYAEQKGTIFIDVHPEEKTDPNGIDKRIIHPGVVSVPGHRVRPESGRDIYVWPYQIKPIFRDGWGFSNGPPIVAGVIALMKSANPRLTSPEIRRIVVETADNQDGFRVLNAEAAVKRAIAVKETAGEARSVDDKR